MLFFVACVPFCSLSCCKCWCECCHSAQAANEFCCINCCFLVAAADFVADTLFVNPLSLAARCTLLAHSSVHCAFTFYRGTCCCPPPNVASQQKMLSFLCCWQCCCCCQVFSCIYFSRIDSLQLFRKRLLTICNVHLLFFVCVVVLRSLLFFAFVLLFFFSIRARCSHSLHVN